MSNTITPTRLSILLFQEGDWLCGRCLEYDFAVQARNLDDLRHDLERMVVSHIAISLQNGLEPFATLPRAPERYWDMFRRSKIVLPSQTFGFRVEDPKVELPSPEVRVAPLAA